MKYVSAYHAANLLGVSPKDVIEDIKHGMLGKLGSLIGGKHVDWYIVESWELGGDRLEMHKQRLASPRESLSVPGVSCGSDSGDDSNES